MNKLLLAAITLLMIITSPTWGKLIAYWPFDTGMNNHVLNNPGLNGRAVTGEKSRVVITNARGDFKVGSGALRIESGPVKAEVTWTSPIRWAPEQRIFRLAPGTSSLILESQDRKAGIFSGSQLPAFLYPLLSTPRPKAVVQNGGSTGNRRMR